MKHFKHTLYIAFATIVAGCASPSTSVVSQPVGPDLAAPRINPNPGQGRLVVYTATESTDPVNGYFAPHTAYRISDANGKFLKRVDNRSGSFEQDPAAVSLPAGKYQVQARATNAGIVEVPVVVKEGKTTVVDLDGSALPQHRPTGAGQWVRLPNGQVIGMRVE